MNKTLASSQVKMTYTADVRKQERHSETVSDYLSRRFVGTPLRISNQTITEYQERPDISGLTGLFPLRGVREHLDYILFANPGGCAVLGVSLGPPDCWNRVFESP
jgi:hypothetical protein